MPSHCSGPYVVDEGSSVTLTATGSDPFGDPLTYAWDLDTDGSFETSGQSVSYAGVDDLASLVISVQVMDPAGQTAVDGATVTVNNVAPTVGPISAPVDPVALGSEVAASASFADPGTADTHTALFDWGDGATSAGEVNAGLASGTHTYATSGLYRITLTVTDDDGGAGQSFYEYVVVYDPSGGFVTGGGWILSPEGAYTADPTLSGKATFGFVSKYLKGANVPSGNTEFQFHAARMRFKSTSYQWLVVAGSKAQFKGAGTIDGAGEYGFILTAKDGTPDLFRIKIWDLASEGVVYDNQLGAAPTDDPITALSGGSIVIHK